MGENMDSSDLSGESRSTGLSSTIRTVCTGGSLLAALAGDSGAAAFVLAAGDPLARGAEHLSAALNESIVRVLRRSATRVQTQVEAEGLSVDPELVDDTLRQAIGSLADAETDDKRRMIEEVLINTARRSAEPAARVQALRALEMIAAMPPAAVLTFAALAALQRDDGSNEPQMFELGALARKSGLPWLMNAEAMDYLVKSTSLIEGESDYHDGNGQPLAYWAGAVLTPKEACLAKWVTCNFVPRTEGIVESL
jgi:hypothetical protein